MQKAHTHFIHAYRASKPITPPASHANTPGTGTRAHAGRYLAEDRVERPKTNTHPQFSTHTQLAPVAFSTEKSPQHSSSQVQQLIFVAHPAYQNRRLLFQLEFSYNT